MGLIEQNNLLTLRPAMTVLAGIDETASIPWQDSASGTYNSGTYDVNANVTGNAQQTLLMDLGGEGFLANGRAQPITDEWIEGIKYGYISQNVADENGDLPVALDVTIIAQGQSYEVLTVTLADTDGNQWTEYVEGMTWTESQGRYSTTITFPQGTPNKTLFVLSVKLGKSWSFDNSTLIKCVLNLRGVETTADNPELQLSEIEIQAYEPENYSETIGHITAGAPIWYQAGYPGDMSPIRKFYLNQKIQYENNVLTIRGYDASYLLEGQNEGTIQTSTNNNILQDYETSLLDIITNANIKVSVGALADVGSASSTSVNYFLDNQSRRKIIANAMNMYRQDGFCINYIDAGIPTFSGRDPIQTVWTIRASEVANFKTEIELYNKSISSVLETATISNTNEELTTIDVVSGQLYWVNLSEPVYSITATLGTITLYNPYTALLTATGTGTSSIKGRKIILSSTSANNPYTVTGTGEGTTIELDNQNLLPSYLGDMAQLGIDNMINRSNVMYSFTYRGNPKIQPRDLIYFFDPYGEIIQMTVESLTLEHENGGLTSDIVARRGIV